MQKSNFNIISLVVIVVLLGALTFALFPAVSSSVLQANMTAVGARGKDIYVAGFDYGELAGAGVPVYPGEGLLEPENNLWTIAKNIRDDMPDVIPFLVTRNVAAESLAAKVSEENADKKVYFDYSWDAPFFNMGAVIIRKDNYRLFIKRMISRTFLGMLFIGVPAALFPAIS